MLNVCIWTQLHCLCQVLVSETLGLFRVILEHLWCLQGSIHTLKHSFVWGYFSESCLSFISFSEHWERFFSILLVMAKSRKLMLILLTGGVKNPSRRVTNEAGKTMDDPTDGSPWELLNPCALQVLRVLSARYAAEYCLLERVLAGWLITTCRI